MGPEFCPFPVCQTRHFFSHFPTCSSRFLGLQPLSCFSSLQSGSEHLAHVLFILSCV